MDYTLREPATSAVWAPPWWLVFGVGLLLWVAAVAATYVTGDPILLPTVVLLGSFLVPVTAVVWYLDHDPSLYLSPRRVLSAFLVAGVVGVLGASVLEYYLLSNGPVGTFEVGFIEELVKAALILVVAIGIRTFHIRDGMVLGAAVGFGFAALESSGYALVSLFVVQGHQLFLSLTSLVTTELLRGVLAPFAHGAWSAVIGGAIFAAARRRGHLSMSGSVLIAYVGMSVLHGLFDSISSPIAYAVVCLVGLFVVVWLWRRGDGRHVAQAPA